MADLVAADVTVTVQDRQISGRKRRNLVKIAFGDGAKTYPANGIPMPAKDVFGMVRSLDTLIVHDSDDASGIYWKYDKENNKLRAYVQGALVGAAGAAVLDDFPVTAAFGTTASLSLSFNAGAATNRWGALKEAVGGTDAPAAQTLYAEAVGW